MSTLIELPAVVEPGRNGYWGASPELEALTAALVRALDAGEPTGWIVKEIGDELFRESYCPTPDEWEN